MIVLFLYFILINLAGFFAMGLDKKRIDSALRVSFAPFNTQEDVDALIAGLEAGARMLRR